METLLRDLRYGLRMLVKRPGFTIDAVIAPGFCIGANSAIFSVVNALLLRPLPFSNPEKLVAVASISSNNTQGDLNGVSPADFWDMKARSQTFEELATYSGGGAFSIRDEDPPELFNGARVSFNFFETFGVQPLLGRTFVADDGLLNAPGTVILSHRLWMRRFGGDPSVVGKTFMTAERGTTVIGVMPPDFKFPSYVEVWVPLARDASEMRNRTNRYFNVVGRIKSDQTIGSAQAELREIAAQLESEEPRNKGWSSRLTPFRESLMGGTKTALFVLLGAVGCVLLIACTNVANLLLARASSRRKEMAIRLALGAGRGRLMRQLLTESVVLGLTGGVVGLLLAFWGLDLLIGILPSKEAFQFPVNMQIDRIVIVFTLAISILTGIVFGLVPAWQASRPDVSEWLKEGGRAGSNRNHKRTRSALIVAEIAIALVLLIGAGLLVQSFEKLRQVDLGYDPKGLLTMWVPASPTRYSSDEAKGSFFKRVLEQVALVPGVDSLTGSSSNWFGLLNFQFNRVDDPLPEGDTNVRYSSIAPDYFGVLKARIVEGRDFNDHDDNRAAAVAIVNETLAKRYFPDGKPIGRKIAIGYLGRRLVKEIVGVSSDIKQEELNAPTKPEMYVPYQQMPWFGIALVIRASGADAMRLKKDVQQAIWQVDYNLPVSGAETVEDHLANLRAEPRLYTLLLGVFAGLALVLASVGIYGVMSYSVTERTHEIGIRMALGARQRDVLGLVVREGLILALVGVATGLAAALALTRALSSLLYGVTATDLTTFLVVPIILSLVALVASYLPARRAMKVDPMIALRYE